MELHQSSYTVCKALLHKNVLFQIYALFLYIESLQYGDVILCSIQKT